MHNSTRAHGRSGFTLIELLVVMTIIASLGALGIVGIPRILRNADRTTCMSRLGEIYKVMMEYQGREGHFPKESGAAFVLAPWEKKIVDHTHKDAEIFFCPSMAGKADEALDIQEAVTPETIDFTGIDQEGNRKPVRTQDRNSSEKVIISNKIPIVESEADLDQMPHANTGFCVLYLGGATEFIEATEFQTEYVIIGPESEFEKFQKLVPGYN